MKRSVFFRSVATGLVWMTGTVFGYAQEGRTGLPEDAAGAVMVQEARKSVAAWHAGEAASGGVLRVVYFHAADREPLPEYAERLDRVLDDVSGFYRDGLKRLGVETAGLPLEKKDGKLVLHMVKGKHPASSYQHESGGQTEAEIREALKEKLDLDQEHVLTLYGLCRKEPDGRFVFDAPYYGRGTQRSGFCHAADCEMLDPRNLTRTDQQIVYTEHYYPRMEQTVARFNSMYLGGTAHELGHGLGLPHDAGSAREQWFGTSLMGGGNLTYRQEVWGGGKPVYLSRASALQLLSHPLITGSNKGRWDPEEGRFEEVHFTVQEGALSVQGKAAGKIPVYAVVAWLWPARSRSDHGAMTVPAVTRDGKFELGFHRLKPDVYRMKLTALHVNGGTTTQSFSMIVREDGQPDVAALQEEWVIGQAVQAVVQRRPEARQLLAGEAQASAPTETARRRLQVLRQVLDPAVPVDPGSVRENTCFLSDAVWTTGEVGWGQPVRNYFWFGERPQANVFLEVSGTVYDKGLYAHSPSRYVFPVAGQWKRFAATVGLQQGAHAQGSAVFTVRGDGRELQRTGILRSGEVRKIEVDLTGVQQLELLAEGGEGHSHNSWAVWLDPVVSR